MADSRQTRVAHRIEDWGRLAYRPALERQLERVAARVDGSIPDTLAFVEHDPVYTIGRRAGADAHLLADPAFLEREGIEVVRTNRGGDITYHGPGQVVGYLFIDLRPSRDLHRLLREVEDLLMQALLALGIDSGTREGLTGIWLGHRKVAAIGMGARQWISFHGFALNVRPDLRHFSGILPCGIVDGTVTSLEAETGRGWDPEVVKAALSFEFRRRFPLS